MSTPTGLSEPRMYVGATTIGGYALFGGGNGGSSPRYSIVEAYDINLMRSTLTDLSEARTEAAATTVGNYALFGGGYGVSAESSTVDAYKGVAEIQAPVFKGSKYKFQNMTEEKTATSDMATITIPAPATGYIKIKKTKI